MPFFFGGFSRQSPVRMKCFQMFNSVHWKAFFIAVNLANCIYIAAIPEWNVQAFNDELRLNQSRRASPEFLSQRRLLGAAAAAGATIINAENIFEWSCILVIVFEVLVGSIAVGFVRSERSFLRSSHFHKLDAAILLFAIVEYVLIYTQGITYFSFRSFRLLKLLKPLLGLAVFRDSKRILHTLSAGAPQILTITMVLLCEGGKVVAPAPGEDDGLEG